ncbi:hypothetical protein H4S01_002302 [Coemansia sp. RSA 2610]|nr:hypothetical protein H4S01_002302 [Coemansia sp. RSA 2610]
MQADTSETVIAEFLTIAGRAPVQSAEDLVVALSQAVLVALGFEFTDRAAAAQSPGLPQGRHAAQFVYVNDNNQRAEATWVATGPNVMMLVQSLSDAAAPVQSIQLRVPQLVAASAEFPFTAAGTSESVQSVLTPDAVETVTAAIREKLIRTDEAENPPRAHPAAPGGGPQAQQPQHPHPPAGEPTPFDRPLHVGGLPGAGSNPLANPLSVGRSDLDPLGGPLGGIDQGGGMMVGPDHPMFRQGGRPDAGADPLRDPTRLPPGAVPPGAHFDPITPLGQMPPGGHPRGGLPRGGPPGRGGGGGPFSGEPNPDGSTQPDPSWGFYI